MKDKQRSWTILAVAAFIIGLLALPGRSSPKQEPLSGTSAGSEEQAALQQAVYRPTEAEQSLSHFPSDGDDVQVFVGSGSGWLGVSVSEVTREKEKELNLPAERGAVIEKIVPDSPAAKAGLKENDVVTEINGQRVEGAEMFRRMIREIPAGRSAELTLWRSGRSENLHVTLGKSGPHLLPPLPATGSFAFRLPDLGEMGELSELGSLFSGQPRLGIDAENLEGDFGNYFGAPDGNGILVRGVFPDSPAAKAGLKVGDVITSVNGVRIESIGELREKLAEKRAEQVVKLGLIRNKAPLNVSVEIPLPTEKREHRTAQRTNI